MPKVTATLEFSRDPLSDTSPTYIDITTYLIEADWHSGKAKDLDEPQAGGATFVLKNIGRRFEPEYVAGPYYPDVDLLRRFRLTVDGIPSGVYYATDYELRYPANTTYSEVVVTCVDGFELLSLDNLEALDPPDATSYEEVVNSDDPAFYYRLGESAGTKLVSHMRSQRKAKRKGVRRKYKTRETAAELGGVSGPSGTYKNTPTLGVPGLILGDSDTAVQFASASSEYARAELDQSDTIDGNQLSVECWVKFTTVAATQYLVAGPWNASVSAPVFSLRFNSATGALEFNVRGTLSESLTADLLPGGVPAAADTTYHLIGTWDGSTLLVYVNGVATGVPATSNLRLRQGDVGGFLYIGQNANGASFADAVIDEVAIYERVLPAERILAHYQAGAERGFPQQTAGARVLALATSDLWAETKIQAGHFNVQPTMKHGQSRLEEIGEAVAAEQPYSQFFFDGAGDPVYLGWEYKATGSYSTPQATFGDSGTEVRYEGLELDYDAENFNTVTISHPAEASEEAHHTVTDATAEAARRPRVYSDNLILVEHANAKAVASADLAEFKDPTWRFGSLSLSGAQPAGLTQILTREIGDLVRVRRRGEGGTPIDRVTHILGWSKHLDTSRHLTCTYNLARGFNATAGTWRLGVSGFSELGETTVLA
jgi:hypothetical protein